jgi:RND family efflux transporter MFP subunit
MQPGDARYRRRLVVFVISGLLLGALYLNSPSPDALKRAGSNAATPVHVAHVRRVFVPGELRVSGVLLPVNQVEVVSRLAGKVAEVRVKAGDFVSSGAVVAVVHSSHLARRIGGLETAITAARQDLQRREEQSTEGQRRLTKTRELVQRDLIAWRELEQSERAAETARAQADLARAHVAQQEAMLAQIYALQKLTQISAPSSGVIGRRLVEPGAVIDEGGAILTLINLETLKLTGKISGGEAGELRRGMKAQVSSPSLPGVIAEGKIVGFGPRANDVEAFFDVEIHVENRQRAFRPGTAIEAQIRLGWQKEHLLVPRSAVMTESNNSYVYKAVAGRVLRQHVVLGPWQGEEFVVVEGLDAGDTVIVDRQKNLENGSRVRTLDDKTGPLSGEQ